MYVERSLGQRSEEHDKSVKEGESKSAVCHYQMKTGHVVVSKPMIEVVRVIDDEPRNPQRKAKESNYPHQALRSHLQQNRSVQTV